MDVKPKMILDGSVMETLSLKTAYSSSWIYLKFSCLTLWPWKCTF